MSRDLFPAADAAAALERAGLLLNIQGAPEAGGFLGAGLDSRTLAPAELFVALAGDQVDGRRFAADVLRAGHWILMAPGEPDLMAGLPTAGPDGGLLLSQDPVAALARLARVWRDRFALPVAGVTGTNGKTTTKDLLRAALSGGGPVHATAGNLNNHLGLPMTLLGLRSTHAGAVIEMGASAVGEINFLAGLARPTVGVITNAAPAHLAEFGSLDGIIQGKGELLDHLPVDGTAILNSDSPGFVAWRDRAPCPVVTWGTQNADHIWSWRAGPSGGRLTLDGDDWPVPLPGRHNGANLAAALLAARAMGRTDAEIRAGLNTFSGSDHRGVLLTAGHWTLLDDSYNANPRSMAVAAAAVADLPGNRKVAAVLGHMAEMGPDSEAHHLAVGGSVADTGVDVLLAVGETAAPLAQGFLNRGKPAHLFADVAAAADWLLAHAADFDRVLIKGSRSAAMETILPLLTAGLTRNEDNS